MNRLYIKFTANRLYSIRKIIILLKLRQNLLYEKNTNFYCTGYRRYRLQR